jgi:exosortase A
VLPASIYLIYERRKLIKWHEASMSWLALVIFVLQLLFYVLATAADIQLFQHVALFSMLSTIFWMFVGNKIAWDLRFPLLFVLFAVPVGEELVPFLQEITADISVWMLELTGIPLFRSGLFIEIPQGKFLVAEACSGVSFLIASIVLGNLYAYMNLVSMKRRLFFVFLSIIFPILANAVRVYGIIYIGYSSDMKHAVGADHLIYGWFFFAFVLICLFLIGELIRKREEKSLQEKLRLAGAEDKTLENSKNNDTNDFKLNLNITIVSVSIAAILLASLQTFRMNNVDSENQASLRIDVSGFSQINYTPRVKWIPRYVGSSKQELLHLQKNNINVDLFYAYYDGTDGELASSLNRLFEQDRWTLVDRGRVALQENSVLNDNITTSVGLKKTIYYWYIVDGNVVSSFKDIKLRQLMMKLKGQQSHSAVIALAADYEKDETLDIEKFEELAEELLRNITLN